MSPSAIARARDACVADNRRMVGKLVVVAVLMFGFGYALVPIYRTICEALGVNVLSRAEVQSGDGGRRASANTQVDLTPHRHGRVRRQRARPVGLQAGAGARSTSTRAKLATVMYEFRNRQNRTMAAQAIPSYAPQRGDGALQEARVLLLHRAHAEAGRVEAVAGGVRRRPQAAEGRDARSRCRTPSSRSAARRRPSRRRWPRRRRTAEVAS